MILVHLFILIIRFLVDVLDVLLRTCIWVAEQLCLGLEWGSARLRSEPRQTPVRALPERTRAERVKATPVKAVQPVQPKELSDLDKLVKKLGRDDYETRELAKRMLENNPVVVKRI